MRFLACSLGLGIWALAAAALAAEPAGKAAEPAGKAVGAAAEVPKTTHVVVTQDKVPLLFGDSQIGELAEGVRLEIRETRDAWARVRATFGATWLEGWVRLAMTTPDSTAEVPIKIAPTGPLTGYTPPGEKRPLVNAGHLFIEVTAKLEPTAKSPARLYFNWADEASADLYLRYVLDGRPGKALPFGFVRQVEGMSRAAFDREEKRQTLLLTPDKPLIATYVFAIPFRAANFTLILKDTTTRVPPRR